MSRLAARAAIVALATLMACSWVAAQTGQVKLGWDPIDPNVTDLAGYRVHYSTDQTKFSLMPAQARAAGVAFVLVGPSASMATISNLGTSDTYFFAVTSFDLSGNESGFSGVVSSTGFSVPTLRSLTPNSAEQGSNSLSVTISGDNFTPNSTIDFADPNGIAVNSLNTSGAPSTLVANITVALLARVAERTVTVTNPGGGMGSKPAGFSVKVNVDRVDIDGSSRIDNGDFVRVLVGYPSAVGDSRYSTAIDLDSDGLVNGADLAILFSYFGLVAPFP